jgi:uncharacterized protein (DUF2062 family)
MPPYVLAMCFSSPNGIPKILPVRYFLLKRFTSGAAISSFRLRRSGLPQQLTLFTPVPSEEHHAHREHRETIRRTKQLLRWLPRRARLHKYPLIGRFADYARSRSYLWSFRTEHVRGGFYLGSILSLLPTLGVQLPIALLLAVFLRLNFMVVGGLQFLTNPFTAAPIYYSTYQLGHAIITGSGFGGSVAIDERTPAFNAAEFLGLQDRPTHLLPAPAFVPPPAPPPSDLRPSGPPSSNPQVSGLSFVPSPAHGAPGSVTPALHSGPLATAFESADDAPSELNWTRRFGTTINALVLGAVIGGLALGLVLDLLWQFAAARVERRLARRRALIAKRSASTPPPPPAS